MLVPASPIHQPPFPFATYHVASGPEPGPNISTPVRWIFWRPLLLLVAAVPSFLAEASEKHKSVAEVGISLHLTGCKCFARLQTF